MGSGTRFTGLRFHPGALTLTLALTLTPTLALALTLTLTLPIFKDENNDHKKQRSLDRADPLKSRKPEQQMSGPGRGGVIGTTFHHSMMKVITHGT